MLRFLNRRLQKPFHRRTAVENPLESPNRSHMQHQQTSAWWRMHHNQSNGMRMTLRSESKM